MTYGPVSGVVCFLCFLAGRRTMTVLLFRTSRTHWNITEMVWAFLIHSNVLSHTVSQIPVLVDYWRLCFAVPADFREHIS